MNDEEKKTLESVAWHACIQFWYASRWFFELKKKGSLQCTFNENKSEYRKRHACTRTPHTLEHTLYRFLHVLYTHRSSAESDKIRKRWITELFNRLAINCLN